MGSSSTPTQAISPARLLSLAGQAPAQYERFVAGSGFVFESNLECIVMAGFGMSYEDLSKAGGEARKRKADSVAGTVATVRDRDADVGKMMNELKILQAELTLRNAQEISELKAAVQTTILLRHDHPGGGLALRAQAWYGQQVAGRPGHGLGQPDFHSYKALMMWLVNEPPTDMQADHKQFIAQHLEGLRKVKDFAGRS